MCKETNWSTSVRCVRSVRFVLLGSYCVYSSLIINVCTVSAASRGNSRVRTCFRIFFGDVVLYIVFQN